MIPFNFHIITITVLYLSLATKVVPTNTTASPVVLPAPPGPYLTKLKIQVMVDTSRRDPYNTTEKSRKLLTSVFTPVLQSDCSHIGDVQYMPLATAAYTDQFWGTPALFERFRLSGICNESSSRSHEHNGPPLIIWTPGYRESRLMWSAMAQYLASYGYEVVTVDHPGDATITEFPDGEIVRTIFSTNGTAEERDLSTYVGTQDLLFVIDSYSRGTYGASRKYGFNRKMGIIGHGAMPATTMFNDSLNGYPGRIAGGVNLDGRFDGPVVTEGLGAGEKAFLLWVPPSGPNNVTNWDEWWNTTTKLDYGDWQKELSIANTTQGSYADTPLLADASGFRNSEPTAVNSTLGTINGFRLTSIVTTYNTAFFNMTLEGKRGEKEWLLSGPSGAYPEVSFIRSS
jgi:hypothetical protein